MICNTDLVEILLSEDNMNFVLRDNIFSLKNLIDIHSEKLIIFFKKIRDALKVHVNGCEVKLKKITKNSEKLFFFLLEMLGTGKNMQNLQIPRKIILFRPEKNQSLL